MSGELNYIIEELLTTFVPALAGITIGQLVLLAIVALFAVLLVNAFFLRLALYIKKVPATFARCIGTAFYFLLSGIAGIIPVIGIFVVFFLQIYIINKRHFIDFIDAFIVWLIAVLLPYGIIIAIMALTGVVVIMV